jgi:hypothetical protein
MRFPAGETIDVYLSRNHVVFHMCSSVGESIGFIKSKWKSMFCKEKFQLIAILGPRRRLDEISGRRNFSQEIA